MFNPIIRKATVAIAAAVLSVFSLSACSGAGTSQAVVSDAPTVATVLMDDSPVVQALENRGFTKVTYLGDEHDYLEATYSTYSVNVDECSLFVGWNKLDKKFDIQVNKDLYEEFVKKHGSALSGTEVTAKIIKKFSDDLGLTDCIAGNTPA